jgi:hypothetical protein
VVRAVEVLLLSDGHLVVIYGWSRDRVNGEGLPTSWSVASFRTPQCGVLLLLHAGEIMSHTSSGGSLFVEQFT